MKRLLLFGLVLTLLTGLFAGCAKSPASQTAADSHAIPPEFSTGNETAYKAVCACLPEDLDVLQASVFTDDALFLAVMREGSTTTQDIDPETGAVYGYRSYVSALYRESLSDGSVSLLEYPAQDGAQLQINALAIAPDGSLYAAAMCSSEQSDGAPAAWSLLHFAADGSYLGSTGLDVSSAPDCYIQSLSVLENGRIVCADYRSVYLFDESGTLLQTLDQSDVSGNLVTLGGKSGILFYADAGMAFREIDAAAQDWGEETALPVNAWDIFPDRTGSGFSYFDSGTIYHYDPQTQEKTRVLSLLDCDLDASELSGLFTDKAGNLHVILCSQNGVGTNEYALYTLQSVDPETLPKRTVLTLATLSLSQQLRQQIAAFNRESDTYRIEVLDYSQYNEVIASPGSYTEDSSSALLKLNTELLSGNLPDLIDVSGGELPVAQYAAKGFLEDLTPYLAAGSTLSEDMLIKNVLDAVRLDGKLYELPTSFSVIGAAGRHDVVGGYDAWTLDAMQDAMQKLSPDATIFNVDYTKSHVLYACLASALSQFVDWSSGECSFDSEAFRELLTFANSFPESFDMENFDYDSYVSDYRRVGQKQQLLANISFSGFDNIYYQLESMENDADFVGYPGATGGYGCGFLPLDAISMTSSCRDKEGAWSFIRSIVSDDAQMQQSGFPILKSAFEAQAKKAMEQEYVTDETGEPVLDADGNPIRVIRYTIGFFSETVDVYAVTPEQYQIVYDLIESTHSLYSFDQNILDIVSSEAAAYFAGSKTLDETVSMIQNRASLYVAEQK